MQQTLPEAAAQLEAVAAVTDDAVKPIEEVVADKGYHSRTTVHDLETLEIRTYISEPDRGPQSWIDQRAERDAVYANRRRIRGARGKRLLRRRGELLERPCAHLYETGGLRRAHVHGHENVLKRLLVHASAFNLGLWMRRLFGVGCARGPPQCPVAADRRGDRLDMAARRVADTSPAHVDWFDYLVVKTALLPRAASYCPSSAVQSGSLHAGLSAESG